MDKVGKQGKVFCIGFNKTGTTSLQAAMEELGYVFGDQRTAALLAPSTWPSRGFGPIIEFCATAEAFVDALFSFPYTFQAMDAAFPGSQFILTVRSSPDEWHKSLITAHGKSFAGGRVPPTARDLQQADRWLYKGRPWQMNRLLFDTPKDDPYQRSGLVSVYQNHNFSVIHYFRHRPNDLLVLDVSNESGYGLLCSFLDKKPTRKAFPHLNRSR